MISPDVFGCCCNTLLVVQAQQNAQHLAAKQQASLQDLQSAQYAADKAA